MPKKYTLEIDDLGVEYADSGAWRSYSMEATGTSADELLDNAHIFEIDQDGGNLRDYPLSSVGGALYKAGARAISEHVEQIERENCACTSDAFCRNHRQLRGHR